MPGGGSARGIERVDDVARHLSGRDQDHVEADEALGVVRVVGEPEFGGGDDALLVAFGHGFGRVVERSRVP